MNDLPIRNRCFTEALATFALVFIGAGAVVVDTLHPGALGNFGIAAVFGLIVMTMIYAIGDVSGAHMNPAVTLAFCVARRFPLRNALPYIASQCAGATLAALLLRALFPGGMYYGTTLPSGHWAQSFILEVVLSCMLMYVILHVAHGAKEKGLLAGIAIGGTVALCAAVGGPVSGASMNPARSLGPALLSAPDARLWIYLTAPVLGTVTAVWLCRATRTADCCRPQAADATTDA